MLSPAEIKEKVFEQSVIGGYRREDVDDFMSQLEKDYEKIYTENSELISKLKLCVEKIESYQKDEEFLKTAIINAQKLNEVTLKDIEVKEKEIEISAKERASAILDEAGVKAGILLKDAKAKADSVIENAKAEADKILKEANSGADVKKSEIEKQTEFERKNLEKIKREVSDFKNKIMMLYKEHLNNITKIPEYKDIKDKPEAEVPKKTAEPKPEEKKPQKVEEKKAEVKTAVLDNGVIQNEKTEEFVINTKAEEPEKEQDEKPANPRFQSLKFGVDFDINNDK